MTDVLEAADAADAAVGDIPDGATVLIGGFGTAGQPMELIDALRRHGATDLTVVNNNAGNGDHGLAALLEDRQRPQDHLLVPAAERLVGLRRPLPLRPDRARGGPAGQPRRADACRRCRHRCLLRPDRRRHAAGRGQGGAHDRRPGLRARVPAARRLRPDQGAHRGPDGQPRLPQDSPQLRAGDGHRGEHDDRPGGAGRGHGRPRPREHRHAEHLRRPGGADLDERAAVQGHRCRRTRSRS